MASDKAIYMYKKKVDGGVLCRGVWKVNGVRAEQMVEQMVGVTATEKSRRY